MSKRLFLLPLMLSFFLTGALSSFELSIQTGKEENQPFSILHLEDNLPFLCRAQKNDFELTIEVICAFDRRPDKPMETLNNNFFYITSTVKDENFFLIIRPHLRMELLPVLFDLTRDNTTFIADTERAQHWNIIAYEKSNPFQSTVKKTTSTLALPVSMADNALPFVGGLDIDGNPIKMTRVKDVSEYLTIKLDFGAKKYEEVLERIEALILEYPDTVFMSELMLYRIRCYHHLDNPDDLIVTAKQFIRTSSGDQNIAEVLAYTAKAYSDIGLFIDADYFFDRLFTEHEDSDFAVLGMIYKGDQYVESGNSSKGIVFYEKALYATGNVNYASTAAYKLANYYLGAGKTEKASEYVGKILEGNRDYFSKDIEGSIALAMLFSDREDYVTAAAISHIIHTALIKGDEVHETQLKNEGIWLAKTDEKAQALKVLNNYLTTYQYGMYIDEVKHAKDALFFDMDDMNTTAKLQAYDELMATYKGDTIAQKALFKKANLLCDEEEYAAVLELNSSLAALDPSLYESEALIERAAQALMQRLLEKPDCAEAARLGEQYNVTLAASWDEAVFKCANATGDYTRAKAIAAAYLKVKTLNERMKWLERYLDIDFRLGNYADAQREANEFIAMYQVESPGLCHDVYRKAFDAAQRLNDEEKMIASATTLESVCGLDFKDIERYTQMVALAAERKNDSMIETYGSKVMQLQALNNAYTQSPYIEFTLYDALLKLGKTAAAVETLRSLDARELSSGKRARQQYMLGTQLQKMGDNEASKKAYEASIAADEASAWAKLAKDALALMP